MGAQVTAQDGWTVARLQGTPYEIGFQNGYLLAQGSDYYMETYVFGLNNGPGSVTRLKDEEIAAEHIWPVIPSEYQQELQGIADGMAAAGYPQDNLWDVVAANAWSELSIYGRLPVTAPVPPIPASPSHLRKFLPAIPEAVQTQVDAADVAEPSKGGCSAFIATGADWTTDGLPVMGHDTWSSWDSQFMYNVMFYVHPRSGYDFAYQSCGGSIWSGQDWYENSAGLMLAETTLSDRASNPYGVPIFVRAREAIQYCATVDQAVFGRPVNGVMYGFQAGTSASNGGYCNEWLIGDATGRIASLQLGTLAYDLSETTNGFYGSCNYTWGPHIIYESAHARSGAVPYNPNGTPNGTGVGVPSTPSARWVRWGQIKAQYQGLGAIDAQVAQQFQMDTYDTQYGLANHPDKNTLCGEPSIPWPALPAHDDFPAYPGVTAAQTSDSGAYDGKVTTESMVLNGLQMYARWGYPTGDSFFGEPYPQNVLDYEAAHLTLSDVYKFGLDALCSITPVPWTLMTDPYED
jgi:hypothetical protein